MIHKYINTNTNRHSRTNETTRFPLGTCCGIVSLFDTISINSNMYFTTILELQSTLHGAMIFRNNFFMVKSTVVQPPLLARLATVSVCRAGGKPSTWFPLGTRRVVHAFDIFFSWISFFASCLISKVLHQPFYNEIFQNLKNIHHFSAFFVNTHTGWKLGFDRVQKLILTEN